MVGDRSEKFSLALVATLLVSERNRVLYVMSQTGSGNVWRSVGEISAASVATLLVSERNRVLYVIQR